MNGASTKRERELCPQKYLKRIIALIRRATSDTVQRCDRVYTKLVDIVYRVSCIVYTHTYTKFYKYTKIHTRNF